MQYSLIESVSKFGPFDTGNWVLGHLAEILKEYDDFTFWNFTYVKVSMYILTRHKTYYYIRG